MNTIQAGKKAIREGRYFTQDESEQWLDQWINGSPDQASKKKQAIKLAVINTDRRS